MISILLVDDETLLRLGFRLVLESQPDFTVVGEAADGAAEVSRTAKLDADIVVIDVRMPVWTGSKQARSPEAQFISSLSRHMGLLGRAPEARAEGHPRRGKR